MHRMLAQELGTETVDFPVDRMIARLERAAAFVPALSPHVDAAAATFQRGRRRAR